VDRVIRCTEDLAEIRPQMLTGFFVGWPQAPTPAQHLAVLRGSRRAACAVDEATGAVVGFVNLLGDGC